MLMMNYTLFKKQDCWSHREQDSILNGLNKPVLWKFIDVTEVHVLGGLKDGTEITSHISEEANAAAFKKINLFACSTPAGKLYDANNTQ